MIVLDASLVVELLAGGIQSAQLIQQLTATGEACLVPHLLDIEVASAVRNLVRGERIGTDRAELILRRLATLPAERYAHTLLLPRIWQLRHNFSPYDAAYIALAEATGSTLYTCDSKLSTGHRARAVVVELREQHHPEIN
jgi:predicted nucleic acid-binding protein